MVLNYSISGQDLKYPVKHTKKDVHVTISSAMQKFDQSAPRDSISSKKSQKAIQVVGTSYSGKQNRGLDPLTYTER